MTTTLEPLPLDSPWLVYDGRCGLCRATVAWLDRLHLLDRAAAVTIFDASAHLPLDLIDRTVHTSLFYRPDTRTATEGIQAVRDLLDLHGRWPWFSRLLGLWPVSALAKTLYAFVSQHRRSLSPVPPAERCPVCDPPETTAGLASFVLVTALVWLAGTLLWGGGRALLVTGLGWLLALLQLPFLHHVGLDRPLSEARELVKQLFLMMAASSLPLPVAALFAQLLLFAGLPVLAWAIHLLGLFVGLGLVLALWRGRLHRLQYPWLYPAIWAMAWVSGAVAALLVLHSFN